jgi:1,4-dihydroxy-2-naphthoyl-CoA hydrolase
MTIWKQRPNTELINQSSVGSMADHLGIVMTEVGDDFLRASMPVDQRTQQPMGLMHGGASATLAETLGSIAGLMTLDVDHYVLGLELNISHLRAVQGGQVTGTARPVKLGRTVQVWEIRIEDDAGRLPASCEVLHKPALGRTAWRLFPRKSSQLPHSLVIWLSCSIVILGLAARSDFLMDGWL